MGLTGAVYGQLAGAFYGEEGIRKDCRKKRAQYDLIGAFARLLARI